MVRLCGAALALFAFAVTIFLGLHAGNPADVTLARALQALLLFFLVGLSVGWFASRVLDEHALRRNAELFGEEPAPASVPDASRVGAAPEASSPTSVAGTGPPAAARNR